MKNKTIKRFYEIAKPHIKTFVIIILFSIIIDILAASRPILVKNVIDEFMQNKIDIKEFSKFGRNFTISVSFIGIMYILIVLIENSLDFIMMKLTSITGEKIIKETRQKIFSFSQKANVKFHDKTPSGKLFARITSDTEDLAIFFADVLVTLFQDVSYIIVISIIMLKLNWRLSLIVYGVVIICVAITYVFTKKANAAYNLSKNARTKLNTFLSEAIYGAKTIKIFNIQKIIDKEERDIAEDHAEKITKTAKYEAPLAQILFFFMYLLISIVIVISVKKWWNINIALGEVFIFITYIRELFDPITRTLENIEGVQEAVVSLNKIYDIIDEKDFIENFSSGKEISNIKGKLEFKNVWFKYNDNDENWVLKDISFCIEPTQTIALVGKTGAGKTTIINLVNRFYEVQKGEILLDGINIKDINLNSLRKHIGNVLQDPFIFSGTIKENIELNSEMSEEQVNEAINLASARDFINSLQNGIYEIARERGENFSVGQKQLIAFARIFALNPDIFILDEATANIDTSTEQLIQKSIDKLSREKTAIFIAHRLSTIVNVDKILVLKDGEIIEQGTHKELLDMQGYYSNLYNSYYESLGGI